ncbi:MAG: exodeoxyribonuclease VII small subunit [Planctomycetes bacterium]|nr:exodeoxyribonuclease VII small subunit [Planctomycetota bacterium]
MAKRNTPSEQRSSTEQGAGDSAESAKTSESFETALAKLEQSVNALESGELGLSEALDAFERGIGHLKTCYRQLDEAERRVERLTGIDADGNPVTEPFDDEEMTLDQKHAARARRRSHEGPSRTVASDGQSPPGPRSRVGRRSEMEPEDAGGMGAAGGPDDVDESDCLF